MRMPTRHPTNDATPELVLAVRNELPLEAEEVAGLLRALAKDYRRFSRGHELVIAQLTEGSFIARFRDLAELASGGDTLVKFGKALWDLFSAATSGDPS